jgi:hypothetical protein
MHVTRRPWLLLCALAACQREAAPPAPPAAPAPSVATAAADPTAAFAPLDVPRVDTLLPGDYRWHAERVPEGPVLIVVSVTEQMAYVYRNGVEIARSTVSTGKRGHDTPTGVFHILQKQRRHFSSTYNNAPMPNMERLTWDGIALHAGKLPGYPASHGCVRLPLEFSRRLFEVTSLGGTVVIADERHGGATLAHPGFLAPSLAAPGSSATTGWWLDATRAEEGPLAIVVSSASREVHVLRGGVEIGRAPIELEGGRPFVPMTLVRTERLAEAPHPFAPGRPLHVWTAVGDAGLDSADVHQLGHRARVAPEFALAVYELLQAGSVLVVTDEPLERSRRSEPGFTIASSEAPAEEPPPSAE